MRRGGRLTLAATGAALLARELGGILSSLGMGLAFSAAADFSRIDPSARLAVARMIHAADIEVQEEGTVAAAAAQG